MLLLFKHVHSCSYFLFFHLGDSSQDETEEQATVVNMKLTRGESEEFRARRMASYEFIHQRREQEPWINLSHFGPDVIGFHFL